MKNMKDMQPEERKSAGAVSNEVKMQSQQRLKQKEELEALAIQQKLANETIDDITRSYSKHWSNAPITGGDK